MIITITPFWWRVTIRLSSLCKTSYMKAAGRSLFPCCIFTKSLKLPAASLELPTEQGHALGIHGLKLNQPRAHVCTASPALLCKREKQIGREKFLLFHQEVPGHSPHAALSPATRYSEQYRLPAICSLNRWFKLNWTCEANQKLSPWALCSVTKYWT